MKRLLIVVVILVFILGIGVASIVQLGHITDRMETELDELAYMVSTQSGEQLKERAEAFQTIWEEAERRMMRYIHHDELDTITGTVARLAALARYEDYPELAAEIDRLRHLVKHIYESELPTFRSVF